MARRNDKAGERKLRDVTHPDDLVVDCKYSVLVESGGKCRRLSGTFIAMQSAYNGIDFTRPDKPELVIVLRRCIDTVMIPWKYSRNWVLIS